MTTSKIYYGIAFVVSAAALGFLIAASFSNIKREHVPPTRLDIEFTSEIDNGWGKLPSRVSQAKFKQVLIGWKGLEYAALKDEKRTKEDAFKAIRQCWHLYRNNPTPENFEYIQKIFNEDPNSNSKVYLAYSSAPIDSKLIEAAQSIKIKFASIVETKHGFHLIRREKQ